MNKLSTEKRSQILSMLIEGSSMRSVSRTLDVSINTVSKLLIEAGVACSEYHDRAVRNVSVGHVRCDEIWSFGYGKATNVGSAKTAQGGAGDMWTWTALDADSRLIISYLVGVRDGESALALMDDVASRLAHRVQFTTDGLRAYLDAVEEAFSADVDCAQLVNLYGSASNCLADARRHGPEESTGIEKVRVEGHPDLARVSTSCVERHNLAVRLGNHRLTRLTNAFSKKLENYIHMLSLYFVFYNFCRIHKNLKVTPAVKAGISEATYDMDWIVGLIDANEPAPKKRGPN